MKSHLQKFKEKIQSQKIETKPNVIMQQQIVVCPIYTFDLSTDIDSNEIVKICHQYKNELYEGKNGKSVYALYAWKSEFHLVRKNEMPKFNKLFEIVKEKIKEVWNFPYSYRVDHFWFAIYNNGDHAEEHNHGIADYACVYYAAVPENSAPLIIPSINGDVKIFPKKGMLVVFPGQCLHSVPISEHDGERVIVSINILKDKFYE